MLRKKIRIALPDVALDALGNPERRRLVTALAASPQSVGELAEQFDISRPAISRHLATLERAGLVSHHSEGARNIYALDAGGLSETTAWLNMFWDEAATRLKLVADNTAPKARKRG
ncbi:MAG: metalloregulator ArsR/SmtB family transcription factor [Devosia sp.]